MGTANGAQGNSGRSAIASPSWTPFPPELVQGSVHAAFERQVDRTPDAIALVGPTTTWTYREVDHLANRAANELVGAGAAGRAVALAMAHDADVVVVVLAVLKAGGVVLLLDPASPVELNEAILADAAPALLVFDQANSEIADSLSEVAVVRRSSELLGGAATARPGVAVGPDAPALLAYSSGTTGGAKAAVLPHRALLHLFRGAIDALGIGPDDRMPMIFPISLAVAAYPMFLPLMVGGSLRIRDVRSLGLGGFIEWLAEQRISVLYISPTVARFMGPAPSGTDLADLRLVVLGGERVDADAVAAVHVAFGGDVAVANGYGSTETGVLTFYFIEPGETFGPHGVPVGRPIPETELTIVADDGRPLEAGEVGDLLVRSRYLFSGYWNRPDLDAAVLSAVDGVPVYRTGDVGFVDPRSNLVLVGRSDAEVKVRGHRVNPGEIEQAMLALPEVVDAVVGARPDRHGSPQLVAWVVPAPGQDLGSIRAATARAVRAPLVPARILLLDRLPQLPNGKLDRQALPDPVGGGSRADAGRGPTTPLEARLLALWERILDTRPLSLDDDLVDMGAQSFDLAWALVQIEEDLGVRVPMSEMLEVRTVEELANAVAEMAEGGRSRRIVEVQPGVPGVSPLFIVHDLHGTAYSLRHLAAAIGPDQPIWGFESPFLEGRAEVRTLEELAALYVREIRDTQTRGPYRLAGYSFGGVLAFEMASQLVHQGETVEFLGIIDVGPGYRGRHFHRRRMLDKPWSRIPLPPDPDQPKRDQLRWYRELALRSPVDFAYHLSLRTGADHWLDPVQFQLDLRRRGIVPAHRRLWFAWRQHWELGRRYDWVGRRYPGPMFLIWADESGSTDGTMGWGDIVEDGLEIVHVDVPHERMLLPDGVEPVAARLRRGLAQVGDRQQVSASIRANEA